MYLLAKKCSSLEEDSVAVPPVRKDYVAVPPVGQNQECCSSIREEGLCCLSIREEGAGCSSTRMVELRRQAVVATSLCPEQRMPFSWAHLTCVLAVGGSPPAQGS